MAIVSKNQRVGKNLRCLSNMARVFSSWLSHLRIIFESADYF